VKALVQTGDLIKILHIGLGAAEWARLSNEATAYHIVISSSSSTDADSKFFYQSDARSCSNDISIASHRTL
jgi:hypothetical protein